MSIKKAIEFKKSEILRKKQCDILLMKLATTVIIHIITSAQKNLWKMKKRKRTC